VPLTAANKTRSDPVATTRQLVFGTGLTVKYAPSPNEPLDPRVIAVRRAGSTTPWMAALRLFELAIKRLP
jgi:hypothetical protein